jgi:hypothetical protein
VLTRLQAEITRSKDEAKSIIEDFEARIKSGEVTLPELAASESDCSSARKRGDLWVPPGPRTEFQLTTSTVGSSERERCRRSSRTRRSPLNLAR